jgi:hypothetical protein
MEGRGADEVSDNDTYVVVSDGKPSDPLDWSTAMARAKHLGEFRGQHVKVHLVRNGRTARVEAEWKNGEQTK